MITVWLGMLIQINMCHLLKMLIPSLLRYFLITSKYFIMMQTPVKLDTWLRSYEEFVIAQTNIKQQIGNAVFANISKTISPTSDWFLLIMSHVKRKISNFLCELLFDSTV